MPKSRFATASGFGPKQTLLIQIEERIRLNNDRHTVSTRQGDRTVSGAGTAVAIRNAEVAAGFPSTIKPALSLRAERAAEIDAVKSPDLEHPAALPEDGTPFEAETLPEVAVIGSIGAFTSVSGDHDEVVIDLEPFDDFDALIVEETAADPEFPAKMDRADRQYELEGMTAKALRPLASAAGMKGARIAAKPAMIDFLLDSEFGS